MAPKLNKSWKPSAKGHLAAGSILSKKPKASLSKSAPVTQRKLASFRAAAKLAAPTMVAPTLAQPPGGTEPPAGNKPLGIKPATPLQTGQPPKVPTTPSSGGTAS